MDEAKLESDLDLIHVIYDDGSFRADLTHVMKRWPVYSAGFDYNMLAILGPQSSGKSTLLNGLFGTTFPTMQSQEGRYQCTKGIWLGRSAHSNTLVMDVEGTDGRERGEAEVAFEKKTSLFSLALAEVLIVNMWMQDVGRNNAANLPLLKTVFDINLQLFQKEKRSKTMLLFIVRDHVRQQTPLNKLVAIIEKDLTDIWNSIAKQEPFTNSKVTDFFHFSFTSLPHKMLEPDLFATELKALSDRFNNPANADYVWSKSFKGTVPADGLPHYASTIWDAIQANKDIDLPTQREMLAMFRCEEIGAAAYAAFAKELEEGMARELALKSVVTDFGLRGAQLLRKALDAFNQASEHYHPAVVEKKRDALQTSLLKDLKDAWTTNVALLCEQVQAQFEQELSKSFADKSVSRDFGATVGAMKRKALETVRAAIASSIPEGAKWDASLALEQLETKIDATVEHEKERQLKKLLDDARATLDGFHAVAGDALDVGRANMWAEVRSEYRAINQGLLAELQGKLGTFGLSAEQQAAHVDELRAKLLERLRKQVEQQHMRLDSRMEKAFDGVFKVDEAGVPRLWKPGTDLTQLLSRGRDAARAVLDRYAVLRLEDGDDTLSMLEGAQRSSAATSGKGKEEVDAPPVPAGKVLLSRARMATFDEHLLAYSNGVCKDAQHAIDNYGKAGNTPIVVIVLLIVLGWNELMYILSSPLLLLSTITIGSGMYAVYMMGLMPVVVPVINAAVNQALVQINHLINGAQQQQQQQQPQQQANKGATVRPKKD